MENTDKVEEVQVVVAPEKTWSETFSDQDFKQKVNMYISFITEVYRALMGSFLILFVPQKCGDHICGMGDNISTGNNLIDSAFGFNVIVCTLILHMYYAEIRRETKMIDYLHINPELPRDNDAVGEALVKLPEHKRDAIWWWDNYYKRSGQVAMFGYIINMVLSGIVILKDHYLDDKTLTVFVTNGLFMALKLNDTQTVTATDKNIFLSAYLTRRIQYNDVDPDKMVEPVKTEEDNSDAVQEIA
tara:strand:+ start:2179 stop:2910 length:732 start_codon:yes stop_codon:yes gene_type:complete